MHFSTRIAALAVALTVGVGDALSQPSPSEASAAPPASGPMPAASAGLGYRSAFDGYRAYSEQPLRSWRESNDTVGRIGVGQADGGEGRGGPVAGSAAPQEMKGAKGMNGMGNMPGMTGRSGKGEMSGRPGMSSMPGMAPDHGGMKRPGASKGTAAPTSLAASTPGPAKTPVTVPDRRDAAPAAPSSASMSGDHAGHPKP